MSKLSPDYRVWLYCMAIGVPCLSQAAPGLDVCQDPADESFVSAAYYDHETSSFERNMGETSREDFGTDVLLTSGGPWAFAAGHRSAILNAERLEPQTNGYLHTFYFAAHWTYSTNEDGLRISVAPALSASSNITKDPDEYTTDALQLLAALIGNRQFTESVGLRYGVCGDYRFGEYRVYPVVGVRWQPHPDWTVALGYPDSQLSYRVSRHFASSLRLAPNGNEWYVKDKSVEAYSRFGYEAYLAEWVLDWRVRGDVKLTASVGREFDRGYDMTVADNGRVQLSSSAGTRLGFAFAWFF